MELAIAVTYLIGMITAVGVGRSRAGLGQGRLSMLTVLGSLPWFLTQMASIFAWPAFLGVWLARGRPQSPWKALTTSDGTLLIRRRNG